METMGITTNNFDLAKSDNGVGDSVIIYSSMIAESFEDKKRIFQAMNANGEKMSEHINETITINDIFIESVTFIDEESGEVVTAPHVVVVSNDGIIYSAFSNGIFNAVKKIFQAFGEPATWESPLNVVIKQVNSKKRKYLTFDIV